MPSVFDRGGLPARAVSMRALRGYVVFVAALIILFVADGSRQPVSGQGWRILAYQRGVAGREDVIVIASQDALDAAWDRLRIRTAPAQLPSDAVTFWVTATGTLGCPAHFAGFDATATSITVRFTLAITSGCDSQQVPDSFLIAIDRARVPAAPFRFERVGPDAAPRVALEIAP